MGIAAGPFAVRLVRSGFVDKVAVRNRSFANRTALFVNLSPIDYALRELLDVFVKPRGLAGLVVIALLVGFVGPFGTTESLALAPRLVYWLGTIAVTYGVGVFTAALIRALVKPRGLPLIPRIALIALGTSVMAMLIVLAINAAFLGLTPPKGYGLLGTWVSALVISLGIIILHILASPEPAEPATPSGVALSASPPAPPSAPALLDRLPPELRGDLVRLSMQDHYVEVETLRGKSLVLLRLADAIKETEGADGLQIHRSHWVALKKIAAVRREGGKVLVETVTGTVLPVSRTFLPALKEKGYLP